ncbi:flavin monoamine oxidase family protein [Colwellia psychrerythraea]|uniref:Tryptophan 2-monooxygenase n=1 Tax=Colwellia psychrerythraea TaxID=28229 RepID=A0A099KVT3_COLPS|nr:NAD(P)/FAD-dependent oxidoreductase [Colwellia psychrerythraea]KGJ93763.1 Tryptophan 2-monooxygenase [Colwellia psychrerythraea]
MSFFSIPHGVYRTHDKNSDSAFTPETMIDMLFDYKDFLNTNDNKSGSIASQGPNTVKKIAIVGAGAAGLVAAYELSKIDNIEVTLYEAGDRLGGRMDSTEIPDGTLNNKIFEMGCMRFPPTSHTLYHYLDKFKLKPVANFPDPGVVKTELLYENQVIEWPAGDKTPNNPDFKRIGSDFSNMLTFILGSASQPNIKIPSKLFDFWAIYQTSPNQSNKQAVVNAWQLIINQYNSTTYFDAVYELGQNTAIVKQPWTQEDMNKFGALGVGSGGFGPLYSVNFVEILRLFANGWEDNQELLLSGIISLVDAFSNAIADKVKVRLKSKVTQVDKLDHDQYSMEINVAGGARCTEQYDSIIIATTTRAMEYMGLTVDGVKNSNGILQGPPAILQQEPKEAIRNLHLMNSSKYFVTTSSKFWYAANNRTGVDLPFNIQTDELMRGLYCLNYDENLANGEPNTAGKGVILISYVWGDDSTKLLALSEQERFQQFLLAIRAINPIFAELLEQQVEQTQTIDWENTSNFYGAFKLNYPGQEQDNHAAFFQYQAQEQGVFLAGDSVSWAGGWLEGAMPTGVNAACAAAAYVGANIAVNSPLTDIAADMYKYDNPPITESFSLTQNIMPKLKSHSIRKKDKVLEI